MENKWKKGKMIAHFHLMLQSSAPYLGKTSDRNKLETFEDALSKREKFQNAKLKNEHSWYIMTETDRGKDW